MEFINQAIKIIEEYQKTLFLKDCEIELDDRWFFSFEPTPKFHAPSKEAAILFCSNIFYIRRIGATLRKWHFPEANIAYPGNKKPFNLSDRLYPTGSIDEGSSSDRLPKFNYQLPNFRELQHATDFQIYQAVYNCPVSSAITRIRQSKILECNTQIENTHGKSADEAIGASLDSLWHPDELNRLNDFLDSDGFLINYSYWSWRWHWDESKKDWHRVRQDLVGNFLKISYKKVPCRLSIGVTRV